MDIILLWAVFILNQNLALLPPSSKHTLLISLVRTLNYKTGLIHCSNKSVTKYTSQVWANSKVFNLFNSSFLTGNAAMLPMKFFTRSYPQVNILTASYLAQVWSLEVKLWFIKIVDTCAVLNSGTKIIMSFWHMVK